MGVMTPRDFPADTMSITPATGRTQNMACRRVGYSCRRKMASTIATMGDTASTTPEKVALVYSTP